MSRSVDYASLISPPTRDPNLKPDAHAIAAFARSNGWEYYPTAFDQPLPGVVFREADGSSRSWQLAGNVVRIPGPSPIEIGNSAYQSVIEGNAIKHGWGYAAVRLTVAAPPLIVEAHRHRARHPLPATPDIEPHTRTGGNGAEFDVYAAPEAEAWVETVLDPDTLSALDDGVLPFDLEITSGWLFLYSPRDLATTDPAVWERVLAVLDRLLVRIDAASSSHTPAQASAAAAASVPLRERRWRVERRMRLWYIGVVVGAGAIFGILAAIFGGR